MGTETAGDGAGGLTVDHGLVLLKAIAVVLLAFVSATIVGSLLRGVLLVAGVPREARLFRIAVTALPFVGLGSGVAGYLALTGDWGLVRGRVRVPSVVEVGYALAGLVVLLLASLAAGWLLDRFGVTVAQNQVVTVGRDDPTFFLYLIPVTLLFVGPFEELVFRGAVQGLLRRAWHPAVAVVGASVLFGLVHWIALTGGGSRFWYVVVAAVLGAVLGGVYERTNNLVVPAVVHGAYNAVLFGAQYASVTGLV